ncbi:MAG: RIP metalloprotease RseP [Dehalococcoidia bacterium]
MIDILIFVVILLFLVVAHELGHFTVAKLSGVKVLEFGVGLPPKIWGFQRGDTEYTINALPIGGFVRMLGEEDPEHEQSFARQSAAKRLAVLAAGPGVNALLPILLLTIVFMLPQRIDVTAVTVLGVSEGAPAAAAGVRPGDIIREAGGRDVNNSTDLINAVQRRLGARTTWVIERDGRLIETSLVPRFDPPEGQGATGITLTDARVTVTSVAPGSPADAAGLEVGDLFLLVADARVLQEAWARESVDEALAAAPNDPVPISVLRDGSIVELSVSPALGSLDGYAADVTPTKTRSEPPWTAFGSSFVQLWDILILFKNQISLWISGAQQIQFSGPVGIARVTGEVADAGVGPLIALAALLSINLAIVNLLPIPALDGGRIAFVLLELARGGRRLAPDKERIANMIGFAVLMAFIALVSINDIQRLIKGESPFG